MNFEMHSENGVEIVVPLIRRLDASVALTFKQQVLEVIGQNNKMYCWISATSILLIVAVLAHWYQYSRV